MANRKKKEEVVEEPVANNSGTVTRGIEAMPPSDRFSAEQRHPFTYVTPEEDEALRLIRGADLVQDRAQFGHDAGTTLNTVDDDQVDALEADVEAAKEVATADDEAARAELEEKAKQSGDGKGND